MKEDVLFIKKNHVTTASTIFDKVIAEKSKKYIVSISGESESGKSEISHCLGILLRKQGIKTKIINMDSFYLVPPEERRAWRKKNGLQSMGYREYNWEIVNQIIADFKAGNKSVMPYVDVISNQIDQLETNFSEIDLLIINGLYSIKVEDAALKVFIEVSFEDTTERQRFKEIEDIDEWRMKELKREHEVMLSLKKEANFYVDLDSSYKMFHL